MKLAISPRFFALLAATASAALPVVQAQAAPSSAPQTNAVRSALQLSVRRAASAQNSISKAEFNGPVSAPINTIASSTQAAMLSSVARLGQANQVSKNYAPVSFNFVRGGSISKMSARVPANFKSNAVRAKIGENLKNSFRASNLRKLPMSKSF